MKAEKLLIEGLTCCKLENAALKVIVCPAIGGRIISLSLPNGEELLWNNPGLKLAQQSPGAAYDPNFFGGIDELLPNDEEENIDGRAYPDHGELWTTALSAAEAQGSLVLTGQLAQTGFAYEKTITLDGQEGRLKLGYRITNTSGQPNPFLWKLHAALKLHPGDRLICPAQKGEIADEDFTNRHGQRFFDWPVWGADRLDEVAAPDSGRCEFFYLSQLERGEMALESQAAGTYFKYKFDKNIFPYAWYFATYGGWNGLYTGVLEPATAIPTALSKSIAHNTCPVLQPGETLATEVIIEAGYLK